MGRKNRVKTGTLTFMSNLTLMRYPGGKQKILPYILPFLPKPNEIIGTYIEPFLGGGSIFLALKPRQSILSDINPDPINLFKAIKTNPSDIWNEYQKFGSSSESYYQARDLMLFQPQNQIFHAARFLFLSRTAFKGIMRYNKKGRFNISYGDQKRRSAISHETLLDISQRLQNTQFHIGDFEAIINNSKKGDFLFLDPPYQPGEVAMKWNIYMFCSFSLADHRRLAKNLNAASKRGVKWALTTSSHPDIISMFNYYQRINLPRGTGKKIGIQTENSGEVLLIN